MSFQQGLSGLNAASRNLDALGNNISNASTVGFKSSQTEFADVFASSLSGGGGLQIGIGTQVAAVTQQFSQGNITTTNNPLDVAINGQGFFRLSSQGTNIYSRNGQFKLDNEGYIVNAAGANLLGRPAINGVISNGTLANLQIPTTNLPPQVTTNLDIGVNLDSRSTVVASATFNPTDTTSFTQSTSLTLYDSLGGAQNLGLYFAKTASNTWNVYGTLTNPVGTTTILNNGAPPTPLGVLTFNPATGGLASSTVALPTITSAQLGTGAADLTAISAANVLFSSSTQFGTAFGVNELGQNGYTSGRPTGFSIGSDGVVLGRYSNGQTLQLGQIELSNFRNPNGLLPLGNNAWSETATSGQPLPGVPGTGSLGVLQASAVEDSNVDLTQQLVSMITAQRSYQANAQTIKTQDEILQTLVNLR
jgi:flagellar hook protein FlgE